MSEFLTEENNNSNFLWEYVRSMTPDTIHQLSKPISPEVDEVMERNINNLLGNLPSENFGMMITTNRENLSRLLISAMVSGYFLRNAEQRMMFEKSLQND